MSIRITAFLACVGLLLGILPGAHAQAVFVEGNGSQFGLLNPLTGSYLPLGTTTVRLAGMGFAADGNLYGLGDDFNLYRIDWGGSTTALTLVGSTGLSSGGGYGMGATSDGTLYAYSSQNNLYTVNPANGMATSVGNTGYPSNGNVAGDASGNLYGTQGSLGPGFYKIDRTTGVGALLGNAGYGDVDGLALSNSTMFAINTAGTIYIVDLTNGQSTQVATYDTSVVGSVYSAAGLIPKGGFAVKTFTGKYNAKKNAYKPIVLKHGKTAKVSVIIVGEGPSGQVVTVTSSNTTAIRNFTITVPAGQLTVNNVKTPRVNKKAKGETVTLTASAPGGSKWVTVTVK